LPRHTIIRKCSASLLLLLFLIGTAPKAYFHDLVADHRDTASCETHHSTATLHTQTYSCHFDDLVVHAPFLLPAAVATQIPACHEVQLAVPAVRAHTVAVSLLKESRGPPACVA